MADKKMIEVSADVFDRLAEKKGSNTWDEHLGKMVDAAYGNVAYLDATTLADFAEQGDEATVGMVTTPSDGEIRLLFELEDGSPAALAEVSELPPNEEVTVTLEKGEIVNE